MGDSLLIPLGHIQDGDAEGQKEAHQFPASPFSSPSHADRHLRGQCASPSHMVHIDIVCRIPLQALAEDPRSPEGVLEEVCD